MTLDKLIAAIKGGPGSGNFAHSGRPGKIGGSGAAMSFEGMSSGQQKTIERLLKHIPAGDMAGLTITTTPPPGSEDGGDTFVRDGRRVNATYNTETNTIHVHPNHLASVVHELGHHKFNMQDYSTQARKSGQIAALMKKYPFDRSMFAATGLRDNSLKSVHEFIADTYSVWRSQPHKAKAIETYIKPVFDSIEDMFE